MPPSGRPLPPAVGEPERRVDKQGHHWLEGLGDLLQILDGQFQAEDIANMILFLSSADARFITGETIEVGGGFMYKL